MAESLRQTGADVFFDAANSELELQLLDWTVYDNASPESGTGHENIGLEKIPCGWLVEADGWHARRRCWT